MFIKVQFFILILGSMPFIALAEEASSVLEGEESATIDFRERNDTEFEESPTLLPTRLHNVTNLLQFGQLMTTESAFDPLEDSGNSTGYEANRENADENSALILSSFSFALSISKKQTIAQSSNHYDIPGGLNGEPEKTEKGGLETVALVGIIIGIIVAVGILVGIIIAVVRKMSGRYSP